MVPASSHRVSRVPWYSGSCRPATALRLRGFHPLRLVFPEPFRWTWQSLVQSETLRRSRRSLGSFHSARRYSGNRFFFLFLRLLRCFSSPGSPPCVMDSRTDAGVFLRRVSPFRHLRIFAHLQLPAAFRSLSRLSSAPSAKASSLCSFLLNLPFMAFLPLSRLAWRSMGLSRIPPGFFCCRALLCCPALFLAHPYGCFVHLAAYPRMSCISRLQT